MANVHAQHSLYQSMLILVCLLWASLLRPLTALSVNNGVNHHQRKHSVNIVGQEKILTSSDDDSGPALRDRRSLVHCFPVIPIFVGMGAVPRKANAAAPISQGETDNVAALLQRNFRPKPPKVLRPKIEKDFAVLLMRSSYAVLDELDCVAMDQFQRDFFLIRSAEYEPYTQSLGPGLVQQGDLTDPYYFDFINFAQYTAINRELTNKPLMVFEEKQPVDVGPDQPQEFVTKVVRRDPEITDQRLVAEHGRRVGLAIFNKLEETFRGTGSALPPVANGERLDFDTVAKGISQLVSLFLVNGFAWDGITEELERGPKGVSFRLTLVSPATIWGSQSLRLANSRLANDFLLKTASAFASLSGYTVISSSVKYEVSTSASALKILNQLPGFEVSKLPIFIHASVWKSVNICNGSENSESTVWV